MKRLFLTAAIFLCWVLPTHAQQWIMVPTGRPAAVRQVPVSHYPVVVVRRPGWGLFGCRQRAFDRGMWLGMRMQAQQRQQQQ